MSRDDDNLDPSLPPDLVDDLAGLYGAGPRIPADLDRTIRSSAAARIASWHRQRPRRLVLRWTAAIASAAALVLVALTLTHTREAAAPAPMAYKVSPSSPAASASEDLDHNGRVDILDALILAQRAKSGPALDLRFDINHDGSADLADARALARAAVSLEGAPVR